MANQPAGLDELHQAMDRAWDELGLDNRKPDMGRLATFYRHPVWAQNGVFVESDPLSRGQREAIVAWLLEADVPDILDYGGGYGGLARMAAAAMPERQVAVYEPFPDPAALERAAAFANLRYVGELRGQHACVSCVDVLEHLTDPLATLAAIAAHIRVGGYLLEASNFYPLIKCHLPTTFYLRYSFPLFARMLGLRRVGRVAGSHATAYQKVAPTPAAWPQLRAAEAAARAAFPALRQLHRAYRVIRRRPGDVPL